VNWINLAQALVDRVVNVFVSIKEREEEFLTS
jgi:hypothetical protein